MEKSDKTRRLFLPENMDGSKNEASINVWRELADKLEQYSWFVGVAMMGSNIRGYNAESSDVDLKIFYDNSQISKTELSRTIAPYVREIEATHGFKPVQVTTPYLVGFNLASIEKGLRDVDSRDNFNALLDIKDLSSLVVGEKIQVVRAKLKDLLSRIEDEQRTVILNKVTDYAIQEEKLSEPKLVQRLGLKPEQMDQFWNTRRVLWEKRINTLWS